jgi:hypothetical protein
VRDDLEAAALDGDMEAEIEAEIEAMMAAEKENVPLTGFDEGGGSAVDAGTNGHERESMYVRLFDGMSSFYDTNKLTAEMITTVLEHESYLFTEREAWVLRHILSFPCELAFPEWKFADHRRAALPPHAPAAPPPRARVPTFWARGRVRWGNWC